MKIKSYILFGLFALLLLASTASAQLAIQGSEVLLNVDYAAFDEDDEKVVLVTTEKFVVSNNFSTNQTVNLAITGLPNGYSTESKQVTIAANSSEEVQLNVNATHDKNPGQETIGTITASSGANQATVNLVQVTQNMLIIKEIEVEYYDEDDKKQKDDFNTDSTTNSFDLDHEVKIGTEMKVTVEIENLFDDKDYDESEMDDIQLEITADDKDIFPDDYDDEFDYDSLEADKKDKLTVTWMIPEDVDAGDFTLEFTLKGEDGQNVKYSVEKKIDVNLQRQKNDVRITKSDISPNEINKCLRSFDLDVEMKNLGTRDQKDSSFSIYNKELGIDERVDDIELEEYDEDDTWNHKFSLALPSTIKAKKYGIDLYAYIRGNARIDFENIELDVKDCTLPGENVAANPEPTTKPTPTPVKKIEEQTTVTTTTQEESTPPTTSTSENAITTAAVVQSVEDPYKSSDLIIAALVLAIVVVLAVIVVFITILIK